MHKGRFEAFTDAVVAIIMTVMVLELKPPEASTLQSLLAVWPTLLAYLLSFVFLAIYWNNHHHMVQSAKHVNGAALWANMHLLFWLSLIPFVTAWMGRSGYDHQPVALYGFLLMMCGIAYYILTLALIAANGKGSDLAKALGKDFKGKISVVVYAVAIPLALATSLGAALLYVAVALMWLIPDRRFESRVQAD